MTETPTQATAPETKEASLHWTRRVRIICTKRLVGVFVILLVSVFITCYVVVDFVDDDGFGSIVNQTLGLPANCTTST